MRFCRGSDPLVYPYTLGGSILQTSHTVRDLGVTIDGSLKFSNHINNICSIAMKNLGLIKKFGQDFKNPSTLKSLYQSLVRPAIEYASVIWTPVLKKDIITLEKVQHKFLCFLSFIIGTPMDIYDHDYASMLWFSNILSLEKRRTLLDFLFLHNIVNGQIDCSSLLCSVNFNIPNRVIRNPLVFRPKLYKTRFLNADPISRICTSFNADIHSVCSNCNLFGSSLASFRFRLTNAFR